MGFDLASSDPVFSCLALLPSELSSLAPPPPQTSSYLNLKMANSTLKNILKRYWSTGRLEPRISEQSLSLDNALTDFATTNTHGDCQSWCPIYIHNTGENNKMIYIETKAGKYIFSTHPHSLAVRPTTASCWDTVTSSPCQSFPRTGSRSRTGTARDFPSECRRKSRVRSRRRAALDTWRLKTQNTVISRQAALSWRACQSVETICTAC